jgi:hypothetical protein
MLSFGLVAAALIRPGVPSSFAVDRIHRRVVLAIALGMCHFTTEPPRLVLRYFHYAPLYTAARYRHRLFMAMAAVPDG